jgi:hypothetical protein
MSRWLMASSFMRQTQAAKRSRWAAADAFGEWLDSLQYDGSGERTKPWHYWSSLTLSDDRMLTQRGLRRAVEAHLDRLDVSRAFWGIEHGIVAGRIHAHALYHFSDGSDFWGRLFQWGDLRDDWKNRHGAANVKEFDPKKGATHYVSKYVSKELADYDLQGADIGGLG